VNNNDIVRYAPVGVYFQLVISLIRHVMLCFHSLKLEMVLIYGIYFTLPKQKNITVSVCSFRDFYSANPPHVNMKTSYH